MRNNIPIPRLNESGRCHGALRSYLKYEKAIYSYSFSLPICCIN